MNSDTVAQTVATGAAQEDWQSGIGGNRALDETLHLLRRVIAAAHTSIVVTDPNLPDNPIIYHNPAFERITGYSASEIDGHNCRFLQGPETSPADVNAVREAIRNAEPGRVQILNYRKNGEPFWNELFVSPVRDANGKLTHFVGVQNDVTRRAEAERERDVLLAQQVRITDTLQRALLFTPPGDAFDGLEIGTQYEPALDEAQFGGDFWDTFSVSDHKVALIVGDLTGKGLEAAQHTAEVKYALRVLLREYSHPTPALHRLNTFLIDSQRLDGRDGNTLACVVVAVVDTRSGECEIVAAGMEPPLVVRADGSTETVDARGLLLGMEAGARYTAQHVTLQPGDALLLLTDGLTEARSPRRRFFGYEGVTEAAKLAAHQPTPGDMSREIVEGAKAFTGGKLQDDVCLLVARRTAPASVVAGVANRTGDAANAAMTVVEASDLARFALEVTGLGYWELDTSTGATRRSLRHDKIYGYDTPPSSWGYEQFLHHVHPDDLARVDALYGQALASGDDWNFDCRIVRADGKTAWIETRGRHFGGSDGDAARIIGTVADITERREAQARQEFLSDLSKRVRALRAPTAMVQETVDAVGKFLAVSRCKYGDVDDAQDAVRITGEYDAPGVSFHVGTYPLLKNGWGVRELRKGNTVVVNDALSDARLSGDQAHYQRGEVRAFVAVPLVRGEKWVAVFSVHQSDQARQWTSDEVQLLETVAAQMWVVLEDARLRQEEEEQQNRQRQILHDVLKSLTGGRLHFCLNENDLPSPLTPASDPIELTLPTLRVLRKKVQAVSDQSQLPLERGEDLETAVGEAAMNAVIHGGGGVGEVRADEDAGRLQVWVRDRGQGISDEALPQVLEKGASSVGTMGHGFWLMLKTCDRIHLLTGVGGTTLVLEQERTAPKQAWFESYT